MDIDVECRRWYERGGESTVAELDRLTVDRVELRDAFARNLSFGTGGLRGKVGVGPNRLNVWTVGKATQGLADYLCSSCYAPSVVIARDSRRGGVLIFAGVLQRC